MVKVTGVDIDALENAAGLSSVAMIEIGKRQKKQSD